MRVRLLRRRRERRAPDEVDLAGVVVRAAFRVADAGATRRWRARAEADRLVDPERRVVAAGVAGVVLAGHRVLARVAVSRI